MTEVPPTPLFDFLDTPSEFLLIDHTERKKTHYESIERYVDDEDLGRDISVTLLVKWTNQLYHDENLRDMFTQDWDSVNGISKKNRGRHRNQYYPGLVVHASLNNPLLDIESVTRATPLLQPTGVARHGDLSAYAYANKIMLCESDDPERLIATLENPMFARLHDLEFNNDGTKLLTASSSLDMLYEINLQGEVTWSLDLWNILDTNAIGQQFARKVPKNCDGWQLNPDPRKLKEDPALQNARCVINNPSKYDSLGLPTNLIPVFINSVAYGNRDEILTTSFHKGEGWIIDRENNRIVIAAKNMRNPHGFRRDPLLEGYLVSDTANEQVIFLSEDLGDELVIDLSSQPGHKPGQERVKWMQNVTRLDDNLYCAIMSSRQSLVLFNPLLKLKRVVKLDPNWGVQIVTPHP